MCVYEKQSYQICTYMAYYKCVNLNMGKIPFWELFLYSFFIDRTPTKKVLLSIVSQQKWFVCCIEHRNQHDEYSIYIFERLQIFTSKNYFKIQNE